MRTREERGNGRRSRTFHEPNSGRDGELACPKLNAEGQPSRYRVVHRNYV